MALPEFGQVTFPLPFNQFAVVVSQLPLPPEPLTPQVAVCACAGAQQAKTVARRTHAGVPVHVEYRLCMEICSREKERRRAALSGGAIASALGKSTASSSRKPAPATWTALIV